MVSELEIALNVPGNFLGKRLKRSGSMEPSAKKHLAAEAGKFEHDEAEGKPSRNHQTPMFHVLELTAILAYLSIYLSLHLISIYLDICIYIYIYIHIDTRVYNLKSSVPRALEGAQGWP